MPVMLLKDALNKRVGEKVSVSEEETGKREWETSDEQEAAICFYQQVLRLISSAAG